MTKSRASTLQLVATIFVLVASRLDAESPVLSSWWLAIGAGTLAMLLSQVRTARVISATLSAMTLLVTLTNFHSELNRGTGLLVLVLLVLATAAQAITLRGLVVASQAWTTSEKYEPQPANPWNSVDQGIDPTL